MEPISFLKVSQDLEKNIERKLKGWCQPNTVFLVMRDQDSGHCETIKKSLLMKVARSGKKERTIVRIACCELESFYLGDLKAVGKAFDMSNLEKKQQKAKFRNPDKILRAKEELIKIVKDYQPISGSKVIAHYLQIDGSNQSTSFNFLVKALTIL